MSTVRRLLLAVLACASLSFAACEVEETGGEKVETADSQKDFASTEADNESTHEPPKPEPDARFSASCDVLFGDYTNDEYWFVGNAKMKNTGNIGLVVRVRARWDQVASPNLKDEKTVRIPAGRSKSVKFRVPITSAQVDEHQSSPGYAGDGDACKVTPKIVDTYGTPQS